jgi:hypothetical protein
MDLCGQDYNVWLYDNSGCVKPRSATTALSHEPKNTIYKQFKTVSNSLQIVSVQFTRMTTQKLNDWSLTLYFPDSDVVLR